LIDLHCHILPGVDDGARDLATSLVMARTAVADGIELIACTPHILPGVYNNSGPVIRAAVDRLQAEIEHAGIPVRLTFGADVHLAPGLSEQLKAGQALALHGTRYFLFEPPHHVAPPRLEDQTFELLTAGYVPILTHPERLTWIETQYAMIERLARNGVLLQITAGSFTGRFGSRPKYWAERLLDDGLCHVLATDAHDPERRPPRLAQARDIVARRMGDAEALNTVVGRPWAILNDAARADLPGPPPLRSKPERQPQRSRWGDLLTRIAAAGGRQ
jgi:protein-tyrosine phosphatase